MKLSLKITGWKLDNASVETKPNHHDASRRQLRRVTVIACLLSLSGVLCIVFARISLEVLDMESAMKSKTASLVLDSNLS